MPLIRWKKISDAVVRRLPLYLRVLEDVGRDDDKTLMSSHELGERAGVSPALVRKDLAWFGEFGKQGVGYETEFLKQELRRILNLDQEIRVALIGAGSLGRAFARYTQARFENGSLNIRIVGIFDADTGIIGDQIAGVEVVAIDDLETHVRKENIRMAIITVPADQAQAVVDRTVEAGVRAILNFAPVSLTAPEGVHLTTADLSLELERLAYYLDT